MNILSFSRTSSKFNSNKFTQFEVNLENCQKVDFESFPFQTANTIALENHFLCVIHKSKYSDSPIMFLTLSQRILRIYGIKDNKFVFKNAQDLSSDLAFGKNYN